MSNWMPAMRASEASPFFERLSAGRRDGETITAKQKSPAENRGAFDLNIVKEDVPSLADLAATYSSKP
jgi:hypothetical protein